MGCHFGVALMETEETPSGAYCPSCGRYIGTYDVCPYCGARVRYRLKMKILFIIAILLSSLGMFSLYYASRHSETPIVYIKDITSEMNYARVRIVGYAYTSATYDEVQGRLYFSIVDENWTYNEEFKTQTIMVYAYTPTSRELIEQKRAPVSGDKIEIVGTLRIRDSISLIINDADDLVISRDPPKDYSLEIIHYNWKKLKGQPVRVTGWIVDLTNYTTFMTGNIKDYAYPDFELNIYIPEISMRIGQMPDVFVGDKIEIIGNLWEYRGEPEIVPWNGTCINIVNKLSVTNLSVILSNIAEYAEQGRIVMVNVTIVGVDKNYSNRIYIYDESISPISAMTLWIDFSVWDELNDSMKEALNTLYNHILLVGECKKFSGKYEIAVHQDDWIRKVW